MEGKLGSRRSWLRLGVGLLVVGIVTATLLFTRGSNQKQTSERVGAGEVASHRVRIGYLPHHGYLPLFVALEEGYFKSRGLDVEAVRFEASPALGTAFVNGDLDALAISTSVALGIESRDPGKFKVFAVSAESRQGYLTALVSRARSGINRVEDLRGKRVGVFPGPGAKTLFSAVFRKHNLNPANDLVLEEVPPALHIQALLTGQVDALATYEPIATQAVLRHGAIKFLPAAVESEVLEPTQGGLWLLSATFLESSGDRAAALVHAFYDAIDKIRSDPNSAIQMISRYAAIDDEVAKALPIIPYQKIGEVNIQALYSHARMLRESGVLSKDLALESIFLELPANF